MLKLSNLSISFVELVLWYCTITIKVNVNCTCLNCIKALLKAFSFFCKSLFRRSHFICLSLKVWCKFAYFSVLSLKRKHSSRFFGVCLFELSCKCINQGVLVSYCCIDTLNLLLVLIIFSCKCVFVLNLICFDEIFSCWKLNLTIWKFFLKVIVVWLTLADFSYLGFKCLLSWFKLSFLNSNSYISCFKLVLSSRMCCLFITKLFSSCLKLIGCPCKFSSWLLLCRFKLTNLFVKIFYLCFKFSNLCIECWVTL